jgi:hypothetical protein
MRHPPCNDPSCMVLPISNSNKMPVLLQLGTHTRDCPTNSLGAHLCYAHKRTHLCHTCTGETHTQYNHPNVRMGIRNRLWSREDGYTQGGGAARDGVDCRTSEDYANFT